MKIARTSSTLSIIRSRSRSRRDFEIFLHLPEYKLSRPIASAHVRKLWSVQDSEFIRWSFAFHHVVVFTVKKRCVHCPVHLYHQACQVGLYLVNRNLLVQKYIISCLQETIRHSTSGLATKIENYIG